MHLSRQYTCWSLRCSWSSACRRCSNYIFILDLPLGFNGLVKDNCNMRRETFKFWDLVWLILEVWLCVSLPKLFRVASLALGQSYDCPSANEATLKGMGIITWFAVHCFSNVHCTQCIVHIMHCKSLFCKYMQQWNMPHFTETIPSDYPWYKHYQTSMY